MKKATLFVFSLVLMAVLSPTSRSQVDTVTILHFNDTHSNLAPIGPRDAALKGTLGGIARAATLIGMTRMEDQNALVLHAGDIFIGDLFFNKYFGVAELQMMKSIGFDAMTIGNHEFDLYPSTLQMALDTAFQAGGIPLLSANTYLENDTVKGLKKYVQPYMIKEYPHAKIGVFGMTTPLANVLSNPKPAFIDTNIVQVAYAMVESLKTKGCSVIICLSHLGVYLDQVVASYVPGINVIVGGHDHFKFEQPIVVQNPATDTTFIVQANAFYLDAGKMRMTVSGSTVRLLKYELLPLDANVPEEPTIAAIVDGLIKDIESTYGPLFTKRVGYATADFEEVAASLTDNGYKDTPIGNLVTDAFRAFTKTDIAIEVGGSTAQPLFHGPIVAEDLFRVVGYGFNTYNGLGYHLAQLSMKGDAIIAGLEFGVSNIEQDDENLVQASGLTYYYSSHRPIGERVGLVMVGDKPIDRNKFYTVTTNEFVPMFLDYIQIPYSNLRVFGGDTTEFQVLANYVAAEDTISPKRRLTIVSPVQAVAQSTPKSFALGQNYPNPFNPSTEISVDVPRTSRVSLRVYNMLGQEVATLVNGQLAGGSYLYRFDARHLASGTYFYSLQTQERTFVKKMMLVK